MIGRTRIFVIPLALAALILAGLFLSLIDDGLWDALGWIGMAAPLSALMFVRVKAQRSKRVT